MTITQYTTEVTNRCAPLDPKLLTLINSVETLLYGADQLYMFMKDEPHSSLSFVSNYNDKLNLGFTPKEQIYIALSSGIPGVLVFMLMFFYKCKEIDQDFSVFEFLQNHGVIKNTLVKELREFKID